MQSYDDIYYKHVVSFAQATSSVSSGHTILMHFTHNLPVAQIKSGHVLHFLDKIYLHPSTALLTKHAFCCILCDSITFHMYFVTLCTIQNEFVLTLLPHFWKNMHFVAFCLI